MIEMTEIQDRKMITGIALVVTFISITGCIEIKKPAVRGILGFLAAINIMIVVLAGSFTYVTRYKIHEVAYSTSQDGKYVLLFQQVGDPDWPFGHTHARLILKDESGTIANILLMWQMMVPMFTLIHGRLPGRTLVLRL